MTKKKSIVVICNIIAIILLLAINQIFFIFKGQFKCTEKINEGKDLNIYETLSAYQTHTNLWLFGWIIEPNTAELCFCKQFHIKPLNLFDFPDDDAYLKSVKKNYTKPVRLAWKSYNSKASIFLNGSTLMKYHDEDSNYDCFMYSIPADYKPGIIKINGIALSETVFDYLENKHILKVYTYTRMDLKLHSKGATFFMCL